MPVLSFLEAFVDMSLKKEGKNPSFSLGNPREVEMDSTGWRKLKRNAPNAPTRAPSITKRQCKEKAAIDGEVMVDIEPAVLTATNVKPTDAAVTDNASSPVSDENTEITTIFATKEVTDTPACTTASLLADETLTSSESGEPSADPDVDRSDDDWLLELMTSSHGRCTAVLVNEDGVEEQCSEETNGHSQLCHCCARESMYRFWRA